MNKLVSRVKAHGRGVLAASAIALTYLVARVPPVSTDQQALLAARFAFSRHEIIPTPGQRIRMLADLHIHPAIEPIKAWIVAAGTGVTLADLDADGLPNDLCFTDMRTDSVTVEPVPDGMPPRYAPIVLAPPKRATDQPLLVATGCIAGDINEDGRADLVVYYNTRPPVAYLHTAHGYLTQELVEDPSAHWSSSTGVLSDLDGDGHLDLMFGAYFPDENRMYDPDDRNPIVLNRSFSHATNGGKTRVLHFEQATQGEAPTVRFGVVDDALPEGVDHGWTLALGAADLDGDLLPEIYAANDFGTDHLLYNRSTRGHISFSEVKGERSFSMPKSKVLGHDSFKSMGVDFADVNNDGLLDIAVSNITSGFGFQESNFVFVNDGRKDAFQRGIAPFRDDSESLGLARSGFTWEVKFGDFDNDGVLEVVHAAGFIKGEIGQFPELHEMGTAGEFVTEHPAAWAPHDQRHDLAGHEPSRFWVRGADGRYVDIATVLGLTKGEVGRALATADVDGDGDLDLAVGNEWEPSYFFTNETPSTAAFLGLHVLLPLEPAGVELHDGHPTQAALARPAIGAEVDVSTPSGRHWVTFVDGSNGHAGKRSPDIHLGLGELPRDANLHVSIRYRNPDGRKDQQELEMKPGWHTVTLPWNKEHASR